MTEQDAWRRNYEEPLRKARAQGFIEGPDPTHAVEEGSLWCPHCARVIPVYNLEAHLESKRHVAYVESAWYSEDLHSRHLNKEFPAWMELKDGAEYCTLCGAFATDGHLASDRHSKRLEWYNAESSAPSVGAVPGHSQLSAAYVQPAAVAAQASATSSEPPAHWGDPRHFEFQTEHGWWRCRLCQCWADDSHVNGQKHLKRIDWADYYIDGIEAPSTAYSSLDGAAATFAGAEYAGEPPPAPAKSQKTLPPDWHRAWSEDNQKEYYYNAKTREVCWEEPRVSATPERPPDPLPKFVAEQLPSPEVSALSSHPTDGWAAGSWGGNAPAVAPPAEQAKWHAYTCPHTGKAYYHNPATSETTWERPEDAIVC